MCGCMQITGKDPIGIRSNAKKMGKGDGLWLRPDTQLCSFEASPRGAPTPSRTDSAPPAAAAPATAAAATSEGPGDGTAAAGATAVAALGFRVVTTCKILECNQRLTDDPDLLWRRPHDQAFLVIGALQADEERRLKTRMLSEADFCAARGLDAKELRCGWFELSDYARIHARPTAPAADAVQPVEAGVCAVPEGAANMES